MKKFLLLACAALLAACATTPRAPAPAPPISWKTKANGTLHEDLVLVVNGVAHKIGSVGANPYQQLDPSEYADYHLPADALLALYSWHGGFGDVIYVQRVGNNLTVYRREMDEGRHGGSYPLVPVAQIALAGS